MKEGKLLGRKVKLAIVNWIMGEWIPRRMKRKNKQLIVTRYRILQDTTRVLYPSAKCIWVGTTGYYPECNIFRVVIGYLPDTQTDFFG